MNSTRLLVTTILMALVLPAVGSRSHLVRADKQAMCHLTGWDWKKNSLGQDPCILASLLEAACLGVDSYMIRWLNGPNDTYYPPQKNPQLDAPSSVNATSDLTCECDTVMYSLYMACSACQGGAVYSWTKWSVNCDTVSVALYPHKIPLGIAIPRWAFYNITSLADQTYSDTVAMAIGRDPEATPDPSDGPHKKSHIGVIVGGVVGGVILSILVVIAAFVIKKRRQVRGDEGHQPLPQPPQKTHTSYYNPDDPTTFPPPMTEIQTNTWSPYG